MQTFVAPDHTPPLSDMLRDMGRPAPAKLARLLGVHERTIYQWQARDKAPRAAALALFWETPLGRSWNHTNMENDLRLMSMRLNVLQAENERLKRQVAYLESVGRFDSANAPTFSPSMLALDQFVRIS